MIKSGFFYILLLIVFYSQQSFGQPDYLNPDLPVAKRVDDLMQKMTLEEKIGQLDMFLGINSFQQGDATVKQEDVQDESAVYDDLTVWDLQKRIKEGKIGSFLSLKGPREANFLQSMSDSSRLRIPLLNCIDAIHGNGLMAVGATIFPTPVALASSFDTTLACQIARITAIEMRAAGYHLNHFPNIEVVRDARWGRTGETFGEDPFLTACLGKAFINGMQQNDLSLPTSVAACAKHFIAGGETVNGLNGTPHNVSERELREIYLPPFTEAVNCGVASIMTAHHEINGVPCHANSELNKTLLRNEMGFEGIVISDWMDMEQIYEVHKVAQSYSEAYEMSFNSGVDIHMHGPGYYEPMLKAAKEGRIDKKVVDQAVRRILKLKFELGLFENRYVDTTQLDKYILTPAHKEKALEAARKSMVLLKNENQLLPLSKKIKSVLVTGPNAHDHAILGDWVYQQPEENVITVYEGLKDYLPENCNVEYYNCGLIREITDENIKEAVTRAKKHEYAIVVVGTDALRTRWNTKTSGENVGLTSLELQAKQGDLVKALHESGVKVVMVMINAQPIAPTYAINNVPAIIEAWELGIMGGKAIAQVLFGDYNPSGRLPVSFPRTAGHVQQYYNHKPYFIKNSERKHNQLTVNYI